MTSKQFSERAFLGAFIGLILTIGLYSIFRPKEAPVEPKTESIYNDTTVTFNTK